MLYARIKSRITSKSSVLRFQAFSVSLSDFADERFRLLGGIL